VRQGLDHTVKNLKKADPARTQQSQHVSGPELLEGLRVYALDQFGPLAKTVLESWGVQRCADFGEIVFNLIEYRVFSKTENDRREDFTEVFDFDDAFVKPFQPANKQRPGPSTTAVGSRERRKTRSQRRPDRCGSLFNALRGATNAMEGCVPPSPLCGSQTTTALCHRPPVAVQDKSGIVWASDHASI